MGTDEDSPFDEDIVRASNPEISKLVDVCFSRLENTIVGRLGVLAKQLNAGLQFIVQSKQKPTAAVGPAHTELRTGDLSANAAELVKRIAVRSGAMFLRVLLLTMIWPSCRPTQWSGALFV